MRMLRLLGVLIGISLLVTSCSPGPMTALPVSDTPERPKPSLTATLPGTEAITSLQPIPPTPSLESIHFVWIAPYVSQALIDRLVLPANVARTQNLVSADYRIEAGAGTGSSRWIYALVAPFPTIPDGITATELENFWKGLAPGLFNQAPLLMDENTYQVFTLTWGSPARGAVDIQPADALLAVAWENQPSWAIVPFEALEPRWKVLNIDGITPFDPAFDPATYPLTVTLSMEATPNASITADQIQIGLPASNLDPSLMTQVAVTGVTALVRGTAVFMDNLGILYPAELTGPLLRSADITHISNEIPFYSKCPAPELNLPEIRFCSDPAYMALLEEVGTDVVELTGDHFGDYGAEAMLETLELYQAKGIPFYGGGANASQARQAVILEHHGNRIAFIGCNAKGKNYYASASENYPGAVACDLEWMSAEIARLKAEGILVIATFQHIEYDTYDPDPKLKQDFQRIARAGAAIVSGSQSHQPHGMTFLGEAFIHYGLGNLFFDQYRFYKGGELDYGFIDWHIFYAGKHISTRLITISWVDLAENRLTGAAEREQFLRTIFNVSDWETN